MYDEIDERIAKIRGQIEDVSYRMVEAEGEEYAKLESKLERLEDKLERLQIQAVDMEASVTAMHEANDY